MTSLRVAGVLACLIAAGGGWSASAQTNTAEIAGIVRDSSGGVLPGVAVTARHPDAGLVLERVTDDQGRFFFPALRIGTWEIRAELPGFAPRTEMVVLEIGRTLSIDLTAKTWRVADRSDLELRWEIFNLFNRANFDLPNRIFGSPTFGRISSAKNPREMQFGLRLSF
jgi:hypothetical protein